VAHHLALRDLHHHRSGNRNSIRQHTRRRSRARKENIHIPLQDLGNLAVPPRKRDEDSSTGHATVHKRTVRCALRGTRDSKLSVGDDGGRGSSGSHSREGCDFKVRSVRAGSDERRGEGEDSAGAEGSIEGVRHRSDLGKCADESLMSRLDSEDAASSREDSGGCNERSSAEVGADAHGFEDGGGGDHLGGGGEAEVVLAGSDGLDALGGDGGEEGGDVGLLGGADLLEGDEVFGCEAEGGEVGVGELGEAGAVEFGFEEFEG
jgi:hypothetical protein